MESYQSYTTHTLLIHYSHTRYRWNRISPTSADTWTTTSTWAPTASKLTPSPGGGGGAFQRLLRRPAVYWIFCGEARRRARDPQLLHIFCRRSLLVPASYVITAIAMKMSMEFEGLTEKRQTICRGRQLSKKERRGSRRKRRLRGTRYLMRVPVHCPLSRS
jgi:hypothetical protein